METIRILHTNDLHSHLENWPRIRRYVEGRLAKYQQYGEATFLFELGDFIDRVHPLTEATKGRENISIMQQLPYDAVTIGNNEGVGNSKAELDSLYTKASFPVILGNLFDPTTNERPIWCTPYTFFETNSGTKIGVLGLTAPFDLTYGPNGWDICQPEEVLSELIEIVEPQCDLLILLSHLGINTDRAIAEKYPQIQLILGSHTHHLLPEGEQVNQTLLAAAGKFGRYIGEVKLTLDITKKIIASSIFVQETEALPEIPQDEIEIQGYEQNGHALLQQMVVSKLPHSFSLEEKEEYSLIRLGLKAIQEAADVEVSMLNTGLFLQPLAAGEITLDDLHACLPHPMHLLRTTLIGRDVRRLIGEIEKNRFYLRKFPVMGMGFRGKIFGDAVYEGITFEAGEILWQGEQILDEKEYTFATVDHWLFIPFYPTIELAGENEFLFPKFLREVVADYLTAHYPSL